MKYRSTRGNERVALDTALLSGIAADGGLFMPEALPQFSLDDFSDASNIVEVARRLLAPFFAGSALAAEVNEIVSETLSFPIPLTELPLVNHRARMLELFHGPTAAFKDVGAAFLAACLSRLQETAATPLTILVATSGDTGGAVAAAFNGRPKTRVVVLFPEGRVSPRQRHQLTCWSDNVLSLAVRGTFDDCQALVKKALADFGLNRRFRFSSANSINIGRLLPQCSWYAWSSLQHFRETGRKPSFIVPTGNLGNAMALLLTRDMGLPISDVVLATNENRVIADYLQGKEWAPRASLETLASAMDVGNPSNMERVRSSFGDAPELQRKMRAFSVTDAEIREQIRQHYASFNTYICPHTATATAVYWQLDEEERRAKDWIMVATAHAAKFETTVEPLVDGEVPLPDALRQILERPSRYKAIDAQLEALERVLSNEFQH